MGLILNQPAKMAPAPQASAATANLTQAIQSAQMQNNQGIFDISGGKEVNIFPITESIDFSAASNNADGGAITKIYFFNNGIVPLVTTNGSGANSIVNTYGDGYNGVVYDRLFASATQGQGVKVYGFNIDFLAADGSQNPNALTTAQLSLQVQDGNGNMIPVPLKIERAKRNTQYIAGLLTVKWVGYINCLCQFSCNLPKGNTLSTSWFTTPNF